MAARQPRIYPDKLKNGETRYRVMVDHTDPDTGKRKQQMKTFRTMKDAKAYLAQHQADEARGMGVARNKETVAELLRDWLDMHAANVKPTTLDQYRRTVELHIIRQIGYLQVQQLTTRRIQQHYAALLKAGVGPRTVRFVHERLMQALDHARRLRIVARNEAEDATPPAMPRHEMKVWDDEEIVRFLAVADQSYYGPLWIVALYTGMRRGELLGLRWQDIDWDSELVHVRQSITVLGGKPVTQTPKSGRQRKVSVPQAVLDVLREHKRQQNERRLGLGALWQDHDLVFTTGRGGPIGPDNLKHDFHRLVARAGVPSIRIHDLRHTHGTLLLRHGEQLKVVSERLGHARTSMTIDVYAHALPDQHRETANRLGQLLARK